MNDFDKKFEARVKADWLKLSDTSIDRLYDTKRIGEKGVSNISDFIGYHYPNIFYLECKTHKGDRFPLTFSQYPKLVEKIGIHGVRAGVILWYYEHDIIIYLPIKTCKEFLDAGKKSFCIKHIKDGENCIVIPSNKLRTFFESDYSVLFNLEENW